MFYKINGIISALSPRAKIINKMTSKATGEAISNTEAATAAVSGALAMAYRKVRHLSEHIEFKPAKTIEEAKFFAKKHLQIGDYFLDDLECANYINEGLTEFANKYKGKVKMPNCVQVYPESREGIMAYSGNSAYSVLRVNQSQLQKIREYVKANTKDIDSLPNYYKFSENQINLYNKLKNNPNSLSLKDSVNLIFTLNRKINSTSIFSMYADMLSDKNVLNYIKNSGYPQTLEEFRKLKPLECGKIVADTLKKTGFKMQIPDGGGFHPINHEIGHMVHKHKIGREKFLELSYDPKGSNVQKHFEEGVKKFNEEDRKNLKLIKDTVTEYAASCPTEFVAETYAYLANGQKMNNEIIKMYEKYGGVLP